MVQKATKHGIRTGNTIRAVNTKYMRRYRTDAFIIRRDALLGNATEALLPEVCAGFDIPEEHVPFSLNKQQRWLLPEIIKEYILASYQDIDLFYMPTICEQGLELVERHKIVRNNNAFGVYTNKADDRSANFSKKEIFLENRGYMDADNILKTCPLYSRRTTRRLFLSQFPNTLTSELHESFSDSNANSDKADADTSGHESDKELAPVRYEIITPLDFPSCCSFKSKKVGQDTRKIFTGRNSTRKPWTLSGYKFSRREQKKTRWRREEMKEALCSYQADADYCYEDVNDVEIRFDEDCKETEELQDELNEVYDNNNTPMSPGETQTYCEITEDRVAKNSTTDAVKEKEDGDSCKHPMDDENVQLSIQYKPVSVLLSKEEASVSTLEQTYGNDYQECKCSPRRFVINVSSYIDNLDGVGSAFKLIQIHDRRTLAWLVFEHLSSHESNNSFQEIFEVHLNANFNKHVTNFRLEGIQSPDIVNIQAIIGQCLTRIKSMPTNSIVFESPPKLTKHEKTKRIFEELYYWTTRSYYPDNAVLLQHLTDKCQAKLPSRFKSPSNDDGQYRTSLSGDLVTLMPCRHSYCLTCWRKHVYSLLRTGCTELKCLNDVCDDVMDIGMLISIIDTATLLQCAKLYHRETVKHNMLTNWCSNEDCGRVVVVADSVALFARCVCGETMCVKCRGKSHWPMCCDEYICYAKLLLESRDIDKVPHDFVMKYKAKFCIYCYRNISVYSTCSMKGCMWENRLCSCCFDLMHIANDPLNDGPRDQILDSQTICSKKLSDNCLADSPSKHYKLALKHRISQHPFRIAKIRACSKLLAKRIKRYILQEDLKRNYVYLEFVEDGSRLRRESEKVVHYFEYMVDLYIDVNNIVECFSAHQHFKARSSNSVPTSGDQSLHRRIMTVSLCGQELCDLFKNGAFMNPGTVLEKLKSLRKEIKRILKQLSTNT